MFKKAPTVLGENNLKAKNSTSKLYQNQINKMIITLIILMNPIGNIR